MRYWSPKSVSLLTLALVSTLLLAACDVEKQAAQNMQNITNQVAADAVKQYWIAKRNGTPIDICVQAGLVSAAYLQAQAESKYREWKGTQTLDCARAGVPQ